MENSKNYQAAKMAENDPNKSSSDLLNIISAGKAPVEATLTPEAIIEYINKVKNKKEEKENKNPLKLETLEVAPMPEKAQVQTPVVDQKPQPAPTAKDNSTKDKDDEER